MTYEINVSLPTVGDPQDAAEIIDLLRQDLRQGRVRLPEGSFVIARQEPHQQRSMLVDRHQMPPPVPEPSATLPADVEDALRNALRVIDPIIYYHRGRLAPFDAKAMLALRHEIEQVFLAHMPERTAALMRAAAPAIAGEQTQTQTQPPAIACHGATWRDGSCNHGGHRAHGNPPESTSPVTG